MTKWPIQSKETGSNTICNLDPVHQLNTQVQH